MPPTTSTPPPDPKIVLFARGVLAVLNIWPVLRLAVQESWGGPNAAAKRSWIASTLVDAFEADPLDQDQVEDILLDSMVEEFDAEIEDGSSETVARDIVSVWKAACDGRVDVVLGLEADADRLASRRLASSRIQGNGDDDWEEDNGDDDHGGSNDGDMDVDDPVPTLMHPQSIEQKPAPIIDDDGFELVQKGRGKSRN
jgi:pre-rRNA-processing protein TSR2